MNRKNRGGPGSIAGTRGGLKMVTNNSLGEGELPQRRFSVNDVVIRIPVSWPRIPLLVIAQLPDGELLLNDMRPAKPENLELLDGD
jgi:hypothetical protein